MLTDPIEIYKQLPCHILVTILKDAKSLKGKYPKHNARIINTIKAISNILRERQAQSCRANF